MTIGNLYYEYKLFQMEDSLDVHMSFQKCLVNNVYTVDRKIIRALAIILAIILWFVCLFLSYYACYK